jgi:hypothetical protein
MHPLLEQLKHDLETAIDGMTEKQFIWHPPLKWSAAEVLEHLYLSYTGTTKGFERVLAGSNPLATRGSLRQRVQAFVVLRFDYLPTGRKSPAQTRPKGLPAEKVRNGFPGKIAEMDEIINQCENRLGADTRLLDHPFLGPFTADQWRKFHLLHGLHHRKQIARLREAAGSVE